MDSSAVEDVDPIDTNMAELSDDNFRKDSIFDNESEIEEIMNNPSNDTTVELGNLLNLPDILDIQGKQTDTSSSNDQNSGSTQSTPTKRSRSNSPPRHQQCTLYYPIHQNDIDIFSTLGNRKLSLSNFRYITWCHKTTFPLKVNFNE